MSSTTKNQYYRYTLRSVGVYSGAMCYRRVLIHPVPPEDALELVRLKTRIHLEFDASVPSADQKITKIGVVDRHDGSNLTLADTARELEVNWEADANGIINRVIDLSTLIFKDNVAYHELFGFSNNTDVNLVYFETPTTVGNDVTLWQWKVDTLWTTRGIR